MNDLHSLETSLTSLRQRLIKAHSKLKSVASGDPESNEDEDEERDRSNDDEDEGGGDGDGIFRALFERSILPQFAVDDDRRILLVNDALCDVVGLSASELVGMAVEDFTPPDFDLDSAWEVLMEEGTYDDEIAVILPDETVRKMHLVGTARVVPGVHLICGRDVTGQRETELLEARTRRILEMALSHGPIGVYTLDGDGVLTFFEGKALKSLMPAGGTPVGRRIYDHLGDLSVQTPEEEMTLSETISRVLEGECISGTVEIAGRRLEFWDVPYREHGEIVGIVGVATDVTERDKLLTRSDHRRRLFETLVEASPAGICVTDSDGRVEVWNRAAERILGWAKEEVVGTLAETLPCASPETHGERVDHSVTQMTVETRDGQNVDLVASTADYADAEGDIVGTVHIFVDVTRQRRTKEELRQAQKMEAVGQLAGGIAHDFNNMLAVINGFAQLVHSELDETDELREDVAQIIDAAEQAAALTRQLLAFSRKQVLKPRNVHLNTTVDHVEKMLTRLIGDQVVLTTELAAKPDVVRADPGQLEQVLINLVVNARDAMPSGGTVQITTESVFLGEDDPRRRASLEPGEYVLLSVRDTGQGMEEDEMEHIFEPFFTTKDDSKGTGLGLSTVYGILKQSGGHIWAESRLNRGSTFWVALPLCKDRPEDQEVPAEEDRSKRHLPQETILVVEDDPLVRRFVTQVLKRNGYETLAAEDGEEGLSTWRDHSDSIDLVLTDVIMPTMNGPEMIAHLEREAPDLPVVYMTGYAEKEILDGVLSDGHQRLLRKPFRPDELLRALQDELDRGHLDA